MIPVILIHGGAEDIPDSRVPAKIAGVKAAVARGYCILKNGGKAIDAVEAAIQVMEDDTAFNAGHGSVLNIEGNIEMDASIMNGCNLNAGAVTAVTDIAHPISLARMVMEKTRHVLLAAHGANKFACENSVPRLPPGSLVTDHQMESLANVKKYGTEFPPKSAGGGTVGAVAVDKFGHVAAGTSTGGLIGKMVGRTGDSPLLGNGTYADDQAGAVSSTGHGESIMKFCLAHTIVKAMECGQSANEAATNSISALTARLKNTAGAIAVSSSGGIGIAFTTQRMAWAYRKGDELHYGIEKGQHEKEDVQ